jgi:hypothetical protein
MTIPLLSLSFTDPLDVNFRRNQSLRPFPYPLAFPQKPLIVRYQSTISCAWKNTTFDAARVSASYVPISEILPFSGGMKIIFTHCIAAVRDSFNRFFRTFITLVSVRKGCFFPLAVSIFGFACAAYQRTHPRKPSISLPEEKLPAFRIGNQQFLIRSFRMETR